MWTELFLANKKYLLEAIDDIQLRIDEYKTAIINDDEERLMELLQEGTDKKEIADKKAREKRQ